MESTAPSHGLLAGPGTPGWGVDDAPQNPGHSDTMDDGSGMLGRMILARVLSARQPMLGSPSIQPHLTAQQPQVQPVHSIIPAAAMQPGYLPGLNAQNFPQMQPQLTDQNRQMLQQMFPQGTNMGALSHLYP